MKNFITILLLLFGLSYAQAEDTIKETATNEQISTQQETDNFVNRFCLSEGANFKLEREQLTNRFGNVVTRRVYIVEFDSNTLRGLGKTFKCNGKTKVATYSYTDLVSLLRVGVNYNQAAATYKNFKGPWQVKEYNQEYLLINNAGEIIAKQRKTEEVFRYFQILKESLDLKVKELNKKVESPSPDKGQYGPYKDLSSEK
jgi:hypothetical protein